MNANDKHVVFITGGSRGIGKAIVEKFQSQDWLTATCATTLTSANASGADFSFACDVTDAQSIREAIYAIKNKFGRLDAVINNAGIAGSISFDPKENDDLWHQIINVNLHGTYYTCKYSLPHLPDHTGRIVNISSVLGLKGAADQSAYCAAKHGVLGFTKALAQHAASRGITVNAICPGWVNTDMMQNRMRELGKTEENLVAAVPLRKVIRPEEIADMAYYLVSSKAAANMTGQAITIDGGFLT